MTSVVRRCIALLGVLSCSLTVWAGNPNGNQHVKHETTVVSADAAKKSWTISSEFSIDLWADETLVANPTAFSFDRQGRLYVAEHHRSRKGVEDDRMHPYWMDDDMAAQRVDDRMAMYKKWADSGKKPLTYFTEHTDRIRIVSDTDGDGRADQSTTYAEFHDVLDGALAGLLVCPDGVWVTNIPHLWKLTGSDEQGFATKREKVHSGFGVKVSLHGHDLHGIIEGPDGRLYWTIGDRGYHVKTRDGRVLSDAYSGAVFRCEQDGSGLEVFATGLRNPQELVFDDFGNLFTVDNDADGNDRARLLYLVEGGEYGWRMSYQWPDEHLVDWAPRHERPWWREGLWKDRPANRSLAVLPPITHVTEGPCGLTREPGGSALPESYRGAFFVSDFRGAAATSHLWTFRLKPKDTGFEMTDSKSVIAGILPTDIEFGSDGALYIADWIEGWFGTGKGRIWRMQGDSVNDSHLSALQETQHLLEQPTDQWTPPLIVDHLGHAHHGVRQRAQFEAARRPEMVTALTQIATAGEDRLARLHAMRAMGQMQRSGANVIESLVRLLEDPDEEIRIQATRLFRDSPCQVAVEPLRRLLNDASSRVRFFATMTLGHYGNAKNISLIAELLASEIPPDDLLRHATVMALTEISRAEITQTRHATAVMDLADHENREVRLAVLLVSRRLGSTKITTFLTDQDPILVAEAARAINDVPITAGIPSLASFTGDLKTIPSTWD